MANESKAAVVGEDSQFSGRFSGQDLDVQGRLEGHVEVKGRLRIGKQGRVKAKVKAAVTEIEGEFEGELHADSLTLAETARAKGTFLAKRLAVREGAVLEGAINPVVAQAPTPTPAPPNPAPAPAAPPSGDGAAHVSPGAAPAPPPTKPEDGGKTP